MTKISLHYWSTFIKVGPSNRETNWKPTQSAVWDKARGPSTPRDWSLNIVSLCHCGHTPGFGGMNSKLYSAPTDAWLCESHLCSVNCPRRREIKVNSNVVLIDNKTMAIYFWGNTGEAIQIAMQASICADEKHAYVDVSMGGGGGGGSSKIFLPQTYPDRRFFFLRCKHIYELKTTFCLHSFSPPSLNPEWYFT